MSDEPINVTSGQLEAVTAFKRAEGWREGKIDIGNTLMDGLTAAGAGILAVPNAGITSDIYKFQRTMRELGADVPVNGSMADEQTLAAYKSAKTDYENNGIPAGQMDAVKAYVDKNDAAPSSNLLEAAGALLGLVDPAKKAHDDSVRLTQAFQKAWTNDPDHRRATVNSEIVYKDGYTALDASGITDAKTLAAMQAVADSSPKKHSSLENIRQRLAEAGLHQKPSDSIPAYNASPNAAVAAKTQIG